MRPIAIVIFTVHSLAGPRDSWFGPDKVKHFFVGAFVQSVAFAGFQAAGVKPTPSLAGASAVTGAVVLAKELHDRGGNGVPSVRDALWGLAGAAAISPLLARTK